MDNIDERYKIGKIYKIVCNETGEVYFGSTIMSLPDRIRKHRNSKKCSSKQIINRNNYYYELIEDYSCNNKYELETRERWYMENYDCINNRIPTRTHKEYDNNNKEKVVGIISSSSNNINNNYDNNQLVKELADTKEILHEQQKIMVELMQILKRIASDDKHKKEIDILLEKNFKLMLPK